MESAKNRRGRRSGISFPRSEAVNESIPDNEFADRHGFGGVRHPFRVRRDGCDRAPRVSPWAGSSGPLGRGTGPARLGRPEGPQEHSPG